MYRYIIAICNVWCFSAWESTNEIPALKVIFLNVTLMETMKKLKHKFNHKQNA